MFARRIFRPTQLILAFILLLCAHLAAAQRRGENTGPGSIPGGISRPDGVDEKDSLKDFHEAMAVQATDQQAAEFRALAKNIADAKSRLQVLEQPTGKSSSSGEAAVSDAHFDQTLETVRAASKQFIDGFSPAQKSGLREFIKRLAKADADLEAEEKKLAQSVRPAASAPVPVEGLDRALAEYSNQQLALGREMGIILATADDVTFNFAAVKSTAKIGDQATTVNVSGGISQTAAQGGQRTFKLEMTADLLDLQQNITQLLRPQIERGTGCGERLMLRQASISPAAPASLLVLKLHYERWSCRGSIQSELAEGDGTVEVKVTPGVQKPNVLTLAAEFSRIDASGMMAESLRSGDLGEDLRDRVSQSILSALRAGIDFKATLPSAIQNSAVVQSVKFEDAGAARLRAVLDGQMDVTTDQVNLLASQLNQSLAAPGTASR